MNIADYQQPADINNALQQHSIAVVGLSPKPSRDSHSVARYLLDNGFQVIPVNPNESEILGLTCYQSVADIPHAVDVVDVFRDSAAVPEIAEQAVANGARYLWLQLGVISEAGAKLASAGGMRVIMDRCIKVDHALQR